MNTQKLKRMEELINVSSLSFNFPIILYVFLISKGKEMVVKSSASSNKTNAADYHWATVL